MLTVDFTVQTKTYISRHEESGSLDTLFWHLDPRSASIPVVQTKDEVFEVTWSLVFFKFDNSERYRALEPGRRYRAIVTGWNIPALGSYRNVVEILD